MKIQGVLLCSGLAKEEPKEACADHHRPEESHLTAPNPAPCGFSRFTTAATATWRRGLAALLILLFNLSPIFAATPIATSAIKRSMRRLKIQQDRELWFFNGAAPTNYAISATLSVAGPPSVLGTATYLWHIQSGADKVNFAAGADLTGQTIIIVSTGASAPAATVTPDVKITVTLNGSLTVNYSTAVFAPYGVVAHVPVDLNDPGFGYVSKLDFTVLDQFQRTLPRGIEVNEQFTTAPACEPAYFDCNWIRIAPNGLLEPGSDFEDQIQGADLNYPYLFPIPLPANPNGTAAVQFWQGGWKVGSTVVGSGRLIQTQRWEKYLDHARYLNAVSPP